MEKSKVNKGRNVINIEEIKNYLKTFSKEKNLSSAIDSWLQKTFVRWIINHFDEGESVESLERYESLVQGEVPLWFTPYSRTEFIYVHMKNPTFSDTLHTCVEFLSSRNDNISHKFPRMMVEHVMEKSRQEHLRMQERQRRFIETSGEALERVFDFDFAQSPNFDSPQLPNFGFAQLPSFDIAQLPSLHVVKFLPHHKELALEMARESALMQHCLGEFDNVEKAEGGYGSYYYGLIQREEITLYSLRDEKNMPHATISVNSKHGRHWLDQIKGKQNLAPVARYIPASVAFFNHIGLQHKHHQDCLAMGVVFVKGKSEQLSNINDESMQQDLIAFNPSFISQLPNPSKSSLWLATLRDPKKAGELKNTSDAMKISSLIQHPLLMNELEFSHTLKGKEILQQSENYSIGERLFVFPKLEVARI